MKKAEGAFRLTRFDGASDEHQIDALIPLAINRTREQPDPSEDELREFLGGHLCRCTGYVPILAAAADAAKRLREASSHA